LAFIAIFVTTHTLASRGHSLGLEIFGLRLQSIASPQIEDSSLSRLLLLPKILEKIKTKPIIGQGLGDTVTVYSPVFDTTITTSHFDWGYLEIWAEMGLYGLLSWAVFITYLFYLFLKNKNDKNISVAILLSFLVINITGPALFHVFGILLLIFLYNKKIINHTTI
jgi:O-antigen ligase